MRVIFVKIYFLVFQSKKHHKVHFTEKEKKGNVSPYGCHMFPDVHHFPNIKLQSLPAEPLKNGEQYYADLAGNIKKVYIFLICFLKMYFWKDLK